MEKSRMRPVRSGKSVRMSFSRQKEVLEMPNLIEIQKDSYQWFLDEGLKEVFDDIFLDTAAGMGVPFLAAMSVCTMGLIVITPDPVATRDGRIVCDALCEHGVTQLRLVINKVPPTIEECGVNDLDECIDTVGAQLLGVVPLRQAVADAGSHGLGLPPSEKEIAHAVFHAMAARLCGEEVPLLVR